MLLWGFSVFQLSGGNFHTHRHPLTHVPVSKLRGSQAGLGGFIPLVFHWCGIWGERVCLFPPPQGR